MVKKRQRTPRLAADYCTRDRGLGRPLQENPSKARDFNPSRGSETHRSIDRCLWSCSTMSLATGWMFSRFTRLIAGCLVLSLVQEPLTLVAAPVPGWHAKKTTAGKPLTEEERATHALNRLTFGPKPGDLERVQAIGVRKWIEIQLNPEQIADSLLEARLTR